MPHIYGRLLEEILKLFVNYSLKQDKNFNNEKLKLITFGRQQGVKINVPNIEWIHLKEIFDDKKLNALL